MSVTLTRDISGQAGIVAKFLPSSSGSLAMLSAIRRAQRQAL